MPDSTIASDVAAAIRSSVATVEGDADNTFGDIGHLVHARNLELREYGLDKAEAIADAIDDLIAAKDTSAIADIVAAVGGVAASFIPAPVLKILEAVPAIAAKLAA